MRKLLRVPTGGPDGNERLTSAIGLVLVALLVVEAATTLDLHDFVATKLAFAGHTLTADRSGGSAAHLLFIGTFHTQDFAFHTDGHGGTNITHV